MAIRSIMMIAALVLSGCSWMKPTPPAPDPRAAKVRIAHERKLQRACASAATHDRLKALVADQTLQRRGMAHPNFERFMAAATLRLEGPVARSRDDALDITVCAGRLILELPPGSERAFEGERRLSANIEYAAQAAADGSGLVYRMQGADAVVATLAAVDLSRLSPRPTITAAQDAQNVDLAPPPAPQIEVLQEQPVPEPTPRVERLPERKIVVAEVPAGRMAPPEASATRARPSFDCRRARSRVEQLVCSDTGLARRDRAMSAVFYEALATGDGATRARLRTSRERFLRFRDRCPDAYCVAQAYDDRVAEIRDIADR